MTLEQIINELSKNIFNRSTDAQLKDVHLICKFLRYKYNNEELETISKNLISKVKEKQLDPIYWFCND